MKPTNPNPTPAPEPTPVPDAAEPAPALQMTPVAFSPTPNPNALGTVPAQPRQAFQYPIFVPFTIVLLTLIFSTVRDIAALNKRMAVMNTENAPQLEMLKQSGKQTAFIESLRDGVIKLAPTDPIAAEIARDFFPKPVKNDATNPPAK
jgi:hypothetical protein